MDLVLLCDTTELLLYGPFIGGHLPFRATYFDLKILEDTRLFVRRLTDRISSEGRFFLFIYECNID